MIPTIKQEKPQFSLSYDFNSKEIIALAKLLRDKQESLPNELNYFYQAVEKSIYNSLSIDEVREFYS